MPVKSAPGRGCGIKLVSNPRYNPFVIGPPVPYLRHGKPLLYKATISPVFPGITRIHLLWTITIKCGQGKLPVALPMTAKGWVLFTKLTILVMLRLRASWEVRATVSTSFGPLTLCRKDISDLAWKQCMVCRNFLLWHSNCVPLQSKLIARKLYTLYSIRDPIGLASL